jgi:hypothetical protein
MTPVAVAQCSNEARTQNGHIRNDTRDVSGRIISAPKPDFQAKLCRE